MSSILPMGHPVIRFQDVGVSYPNEEGEPATVALSGVTFTLRQGEFLFLTGDTGAGKSSLVRVLYGEAPLISGSAEVCGRLMGGLSRGALAKLRREIGVVHQEFHLLERKTALENVALPLLFDEVGRREALSRAREALADAGVAPFEKKRVRELSGGEKQRVAMARAMVVRPSLIAADEPTADLDPEHADEIFAHLERAHGLGAAIIVATHDVERVERSRHSYLRLDHGRVGAKRGDVEARVG